MYVEPPQGPSAPFPHLLALPHAIHSLSLVRYLCPLQARLREIRSLEGLLLEDLSGGQERLPIPVINTVNDRTLPTDLTYIKDYTWAPYVERLVR